MNKSVIASICQTTADYRSDEGLQPTPDRVERWVGQFDEKVCDDLLAELDHVLKKTYISKANVDQFLSECATSNKLTGGSPKKFWKNVGLLDIQQSGASQQEMLAAFKKALDQHSISTPNNHDGLKEFVYLDDGVFGGGHVINDLRNWIETSAPTEAKVHIIVMVLHAGGEHYADKKITESAKNAGKNINVSWWREKSFEDRRSYTDNSDVLRPKQIPDLPEVARYFQKLNDAGYPPTLRTGNSLGSQNIFSSPEGRTLLEEQLLIAGCRIMERCPNLPSTARPLGFSLLKTIGFGSMVVTYRNCPNNSPLALWAGDPWYPLFQRRTNTDTVIRQFFKPI